MIAIIGGGFTGLALGRELDARGLEFTIIEADAEVGGVIGSAEVDGHVLDWGPQRTRAVESVRRLVDDLGLSDRVLPGRADARLLIHRAGRLRRVPLTARELITTDALSLAGRLRLLLEPLTAPPGIDERVGVMLRRKLGRAAYDAVAGPLYGGLFGTDPADMVVGDTLTPLLRQFGVRRSLLLAALRRNTGDAPASFTFDRGMQTLPRAMGDALGPRVRRSTRAHAITRRGEGYRVELDDGSLDAAAVVLTVPSAEAARLLEDVAPEAAAGIARLRANTIAVVHLIAETTLDGVGFQVALSERRALRGVTFNHSLFGRTNLYTAYLEAGDGDDASLRATAAAEFHRLTGFSADVLSVARVRMPAWDLSWQALRGVRLPDGVIAAANWESRPGLPGRLARAAAVATQLAERFNTVGRAA